MPVPDNEKNISGGKICPLLPPNPETFPEFKAVTFNEMFKILKDGLQYIQGVTALPENKRAIAISITHLETSELWYNKAKAGHLASQDGEGSPMHEAEKE